MNNRMNRPQNGHGRRPENTPEQPWSPYTGSAPYGPTEGYNSPYGPESPIDFGQHERYSDPYREYQGASGYGPGEPGYRNRGDYRGNDEEYGFNQPGYSRQSYAPSGSTRYPVSGEYGRSNSRWEPQERGFPEEQRFGNPNMGYGPGREELSRQEYSSPRQHWGPQQGNRSWSEGYESPGSYTRKQYSGPEGAFGEHRVHSPTWNQNHVKPTYNEQSESSTYDRPWTQGPHSGRGPKGYQRADDSIREDVCERLSYHGFIDPSDVDVNVDHGEVRLSGTCSNRREKRMIEDVVDSVRGVHDVRNELSIGPSSSEQSEPDSSMKTSSQKQNGNGSRTSKRSRSTA